MLLIEGRLWLIVLLGTSKGMKVFPAARKPRMSGLMSRAISFEMGRRQIKIKEF